MKADASMRSDLAGRYENASDTEVVDRDADGDRFRGAPQPDDQRRRLPRQPRQVGELNLEKWLNRAARFRDDTVADAFELGRHVRREHGEAEDSEDEGINDPPEHMGAVAQYRSTRRRIK